MGLLRSDHRFGLSVLLLALTMRPAMGGGPGLGKPRGGPEFAPYDHKDQVDAIAEAQNNFTRDLYLALAKDSTDNLFFSPFSIMTAIAMTHTGAQANTMDEIRKVLHLPESKDDIYEGFHDVVKDIKTPVNEYELRTSNMAYVSHKLTLLEEFANVLINKFHSISKTVDFGESEAVRSEINQAVEKETNSRIKDLIPAGVLNSLTRMVLVNAVYFKGTWLKQFDEADTKNLPFWTTKDSSVNVPMMYLKDNFRLFHNRELGAKLLSMDYEGERLSMVIVLPDEVDGLATVEAKLANMDLNTLDKRMGSIKVEVTLPKFKLEESLELVPHLQGMGIKDLFDERNADLSGIGGTKDLFVSNVIHKAFLEVNEKGSEAASATAVVIMTRMMIREPPPFKADHPFFFYIRDRRSNFILFSGRYVKPVEN